MSWSRSGIGPLPTSSTTTAESQEKAEGPGRALRFPLGLSAAQDYLVR
jgi:hypothetical protein